jgi:hypothetical protein
MSKPKPTGRCSVQILGLTWIGETSARGPSRIHAVAIASECPRDTIAPQDCLHSIIFVLSGRSLILNGGQTALNSGYSPKRLTNALSRQSKVARLPSKFSNLRAICKQMPQAPWRENNDHGKYGVPFKGQESRAFISGGIPFQKCNILQLDDTSRSQLVAHVCWRHPAIWTCPRV